MTAGHQPATGSFDDSGLVNFTFERELGSGGMGRVSLVTSKVTGYRFAVKICRFDEPEMRAAFQKELLLWLDLPHHPYLAPCYFFRSAGEGVAIFSEYFENGSLADWIADARFNSVKELLDIALFTARGLSFLHDLGYVHRDIKPRNVLMDKNATPRIADFGLAVPGLLVKRSAANVPSGMTADYRSPEQASGGPLGPATDVWSWAVSVLELFVGQVTWLDGQVADEVLEGYAQHPEDACWPMPRPLVDTLRRCLQRDAARRCRSMREVVDALKPAYDRVSAVAPATLLPEEPSPSPPLRHIDSSSEGIGWFSPDFWNNFLHQRHALNIAAPEQLYLPVGSRNGRALADLIAYAEFEEDMRRLAAKDRDARGPLAAFYGNKGSIHLALGDAARAIELYDRSVAIGRELLAEGDRQAANLLLAVYAKKALTLGQQGNIPAMGKLFDAADKEDLAGRYTQADSFAYFQLQKANYASRSGRQKDAHEIADGVISLLDAGLAEDTSTGRALAAALAAKAEISNQWGQNPQALELLQRAIRICDSLNASQETSGEDRKTIVGDVARFRNLRASILIETGRAQEGIGEIRQALRDFEWLIDSGETQEASKWAASLGTQANALMRSEQFDEAGKVYDRAIEHLEKLIETEGLESLELALARVCINKYGLHTRRQQYQLQIALLDRGIQLMERWRTRANSRELSYDLARAYDNRALAYMAARDFQAALAMCDRVLKVYDELAAQGDSSDLQGDIAWGHVNRAYVLFFLERVAESFSELQKSVPVLIREQKRTGRKDFEELIAKVRQLFGDRDW
jgi:serine/threonine protein kinase